MRLSPVTYEQWVKVFKAALYVGVSAVLSYLISALTSDPDSFGVLTPIVNVVLVTLKQLFTPPEK